MNLLQGKAQPASSARPPHHSTQKLSRNHLLVLNLRTFWDLLKSTQGLTDFRGCCSSPGHLDHPALSPCWCLVLQWAPGALHQPRAVTEGLWWNGDGSSAWAVHTQPNNTATGPSPGLGQDLNMGRQQNSWDAAAYFTCWSPTKSGNPKWIGVLSIWTVGKPPVLGASSPEIFPFPYKQTKELSLGLPSPCCSCQVSAPYYILP